MSTNREQLLHAANIVRPALAGVAYVPALTHLRFDQEGVTAFDDVSAINVFVPDHELNCCVPGDLFIRALNGFSAKDVIVAPGKDGTIVLKSGKGKVTLPTLALADHPFSWKSVEGKANYSFILTEDILKGMSHCLISVGANPHHPAQMGLTLDMQDGTNNAIIYSTDNSTITRYITRTQISLPAEAPVLLPTFFCEQALALSKAYPKSRMTLQLYHGAVKLSVTDEGDEVAMLHTRLLFEVDPLDYGMLFAKSVQFSAKDMLTIPPGWDEALARCLLVLGTEIDKAVIFSTDGDDLTIKAKSGMGEAVEEFQLKGAYLNKALHLDPTLLLRAAPLTSTLYFGAKGFVLGSDDGRLTHVIAYYQPSKEK